MQICPIHPCNFRRLSVTLVCPTETFYKTAFFLVLWFRGLHLVLEKQHDIHLALLSLKGQGTSNLNKVETGNDMFKIFLTWQLFKSGHSLICNFEIKILKENKLK